MSDEEADVLDPEVLAEEVTLDTWAEAPNNRWAFLNLERVLPTTSIRAAVSTDPTPLGRDDRPLLKTPVPRHDGSGRIERYTSAEEVLTETWTDGFIVLKDGVIVAEEYQGLMGPETKHLLMSVTKSVVGVVACVLADRGLLPPRAVVGDLIPELAESGFAEARVRDVLDMRTGVRFNETYHDPDADVYLMEHAVGWRSPREDVPGTLHEFLAGLPTDEEHGKRFRYRSSDTNVLGWLCEAVTGRPLAQLISELIWQPLGAEHDANITVDSVGTAVADGGMSATLRDVARFGEMLRRNGTSARGVQIAPEWFVSDTLLAAEDSKDAFAATNSPTGMPGGHYRNQVWVPFRQRSVMLGLGIHGQMLYVNQRAGVTGVKLSTWPRAQDPVAFYDTLGAFEAISRVLGPRAEPPVQKYHRE